MSCCGQVAAEAGERVFSFLHIPVRRVKRFTILWLPSIHTEYGGSDYQKMFLSVPDGNRRTAGEDKDEHINAAALQHTHRAEFSS